MKVLIVGASGFVGRFLTWELENQYDLVLSDILLPDDNRLPWIYKALDLERSDQYLPKPSAGIPFIQGDVMDVELCKRITEGVDVVINLSANINFEEPVECFKVNTVSMFNLLVTAAENKVKRFLSASSINASGLFHCRVTDRKRDWAYLPVDEDIPTDLEDAYSLSKYCNELSLKAWTNRTEITTAAFRFSGVLPPEWTDSYKKKVQPTTQWPETLGEYVDLRDVTRGLQQAIERKDLPRYGVYQLTAKDTVMPEPTMEIIEQFRPDLLKVLRKELPDRTSMLSWQRANDAFGYVPKHSWKEV